MLKIPQNIKYALNTLAENGYEAYIVGGCVRDALLGLTPTDYDITTSARPKEIISLFEKTIPTGLEHGTVTVLIEKEPIEITTFRTEGAYLDSRHPEKVEFVTDLREDLSRRDFTVNALAFSEKTGLVDYYGGVADLKNKVLRAVGNPEKRFSEDALRILRLFRFASRLDFEIEKNTFNSAIKLQKGLENISRERIFAEIKKGVTGKNPNALSPLINFGGLEFLNITTAPDFNGINENLRLFHLLNANESPIKILKELKASNREITFTDKMLRLIRLNPKTKEELKNALFLTDLDTVRAFSEYTNQNTALLEKIIENKEAYLISHLKLGGKDLELLGFKGKEIRNQLELLRQAVVKNPKINTKDALLALTKNNSAP